MALPKNNSKRKAARVLDSKSAPATLRSMSGAGFEFEDLISASYLLKTLSGERATSIGLITQIQAQVSALGWHIDDLLITASEAHVTRRLQEHIKQLR